MLHELNELRLAEDQPDSPAYVRDRTPLKKGEMTTLALRNEFRRDPVLPILIGDDVFIRGVRRGIEQGGIRLPARGTAVRPGRPRGQYRDRRTGGGFHHGLRPQHRHLAAPAAGCRGAGNRQARICPAGRRRHRRGVVAEASAFPSAGRAAAAPDQLSAEGLLREALAQVWEQARARGIGDIGTLAIRPVRGGRRLPAHGRRGGRCRAPTRP